MIRERSPDDWARLAHARIKAAHDAIVAAAPDLGVPRPIVQVTNLLEAADIILREWLARPHRR